MPLYEYYCKQCRGKVTVLVRRRDDSTLPSCPCCGSGDLRRLFSTFAVRRSFMDGYDDILSDSQLVKGLEASDPHALAEWNKRMSRGMEEEGDSPEYEEMVERMEGGEIPSELVSQLKGEEEHTEEKE